MTNLLDTYTTLPEAVIVHHSFEVNDWRPEMQSNDIRRHWIVDASGTLQTSPYREQKALDTAQNRDEFLCEGTIQINFLIDESRVIKPVLGNYQGLALVAGMPWTWLFPFAAIRPSA